MATVWAVAVIGVLWTVALGFVTVGGARVVRHRTQTAADLTALAVAAQAVPLGADACRQGEAVAAANGARLERCAVVGPVADVIVAADAHLPLLGVRTVTARARAGPDGRGTPL
jgi:secretion/DNA translocation related TadE-like protein